MLQQQNRWRKKTRRKLQKSHRAWGNDDKHARPNHRQAFRTGRLKSDRSQLSDACFTTLARRFAKQKKLALLHNKLTSKSMLRATDIIRVCALKKERTLDDSVTLTARCGDYRRPGESRRDPGGHGRRPGRGSGADRSGDDYAAQFP
ncbi:hypothetical protein EMIT0P260_150104 [Pseudomonas sp. IT-P260]